MEEDGGTTADLQKLAAQVAMKIPNPYVAGAGAVLATLTSLGLHFTDSDDYIGSFSLRISAGPDRVIEWSLGDRVLQMFADPSDPGNEKKREFRMNGDGSDYTGLFRVRTPTKIGIGPFDLLRPMDRVLGVKAFRNNTPLELVLCDRPGTGAASLLRWQQGDRFSVAFDHPDASGASGMGPFDLKSVRDRIIAADVDGDKNDELLLYRSGSGAASLVKWKNGNQFDTIFDHPDAPGRATGIGSFDLRDERDEIISA